MILKLVCRSMQILKLLDIFRKSGMLGQDEKWTYENKKKIEIMSSFNYLGVVLSSRVHLWKQQVCFRIRL